ncbi:hypothetical protein GCM10027190_20340 [Spirosoma areae]
MVGAVPEMGIFGNGNILSDSESEENVQGYFDAGAQIDWYVPLNRQRIGAYS